MSQAGRQDFTDKVTSAVKPDSQKTTGESITDNIKGKVDNALDTLQPEDSKNTTQKAGDAVSGSGQDQRSLIDKARDAVGLGDGKY